MFDVTFLTADVLFLCVIFILLIANFAMLHFVLTYKKQILKAKQQDTYIHTLEQRLDTQVLHLNDADNTADQDASLHAETTIVMSEKNAALARLAGGLAHDFNNILSIIDGYTRICLKDTELPAAIRDYLQKIDHAAQRGAQLTHKITVFGPHQAETNTVIDVRDTINHLTPRLQTMLPPDTTLHMSTSDEPLIMRTHNDALAQILDELFKNSCAFIPKGGSISAHASRSPLPASGSHNHDTDAFIKICFKDNGPGITQRDLSKIFDPFYTTNTTRNQSGLGLSVVYGLVKQLQGHIFVQSSAEHGTQFDLYFPESHETTKVRSIEGCLTDPNSLKMQGYTVLVVDDEPDLLRITAAMLEDLDLTVLSASHPDEALLVQDEYEGTIDLLVTDIAMPVLNGVQLSEMMHALHPSMQTLFVSGFPGRGDMENYAIPDDATFISKPLYFEDLAIIIYSKLTGTHIDPDMLRTRQWKAAVHA